MAAPGLRGVLRLAAWWDLAWAGSAGRLAPVRSPAAVRCRAGLRRRPPPPGGVGSPGRRAGRSWRPASRFWCARSRTVAGRSALRASALPALPARARLARAVGALEAPEPAGWPSPGIREVTGARAAESVVSGEADFALFAARARGALDGRRGRVGRRLVARGAELLDLAAAPSGPRNAIPAATITVPATAATPPAPPPRRPPPDEPAAVSDHRPRLAPVRTYHPARRRECVTRASPRATPRAPTAGTRHPPPAACGSRLARATLLEMLLEPRAVGRSTCSPSWTR